MTVPYRLRAAYHRDVDDRLADAAADRVIVDRDVCHLPAPVQRYLRFAGVVGQPRVRNVRARMHGRIRSGRHARWMTLNAEQHNFFDPPARFFYLNASMWMIPIQGYHRYAGGSATMRIKAAGCVPLVDASGEAMTQSETVTLFNDMCILAPGTLIDPAIVWDPVDDRTARATFANAGHRISAVLSFNDAGELTDFSSDDRGQLSSDGRQMRQMRWSTPLTDYRAFGHLRLASRGEARWHDPDGAYAYIELTFDDVRCNV